MAWISSLEVPLFIGRVYLREGKIELFTTQRLHQALLEQPYEHIELLLDSGIEQPAPPGARRLNVARPYIRGPWPKPRICNCWSGHTPSSGRISKRYRQTGFFRSIQSHKVLQWETGQPPTDAQK